MGLTFPCPVPTLFNYVPHRPPMVWIDEVTDVSATSCATRITLKEGGLYMGSNGLRPSSCLEFIAQSYGYGSACYKIQTLGDGAKPVTRAFLASFKDVSFAAPEIFQTMTAGTRLEIRVSGVRQMGAITLLNGRVLAEGQELCAGNLKVFTAVDA